MRKILGLTLALLLTIGVMSGFVFGSDQSVSVEKFENKVLISSGEYETMDGGPSPDFG